MYTYEGLSWRTPLVMGCVVLHGLLSALSDGLLLVFTQSQIDAEPVVALLVLMAGLGSLGMFLLSIVAVGLWTYRAMANAHVLAGEENAPSISAGYAIGSYFVPFVNLYQPYKAMQVIHSVSTGVFTSGLVTAWWGTWIGGNMLGNLAFRLDSSELGLAGALVTTVCAVLLSMLVMEVDKAQVALEQAQREARTPEVSTYRAPIGKGLPG